MKLHTLLFVSAALAGGAAVADANGPAEQGAALLMPFKTTLKQALMEGMQKGPPTAIEVCSDKAPAIARDLSTEGVTMGRSSHRLRNPDNAPPVWLAPILDDYVSGDTDLQPQLVELEGGRHGYAEPIVMQPLCLTCHGTELSPDIAARIEALYPDDQATGFSDGEFRGVFWIEF